MREKLKLSKRVFASIDSKQEQLQISLKLSKLLDGVQVLQPFHVFERIVQRSTPEEQESIFRSLAVLARRLKDKNPPNKKAWVWAVHGAGKFFGRGTSLETYLTKDMVPNLSKQEQEENWKNSNLNSSLSKFADEEFVDLADALEGPRCISCGGVAHPDTGWQVSEKAILCGPCALYFAKWYRKRMTNQNREIDGSSWNENAAKSIIGDED